MKILVSWSSGKDSAWMLHVLNQQSPGAAAALLTTVSEAYDRVAMHGVRASVLRAQADAAGLPLITVLLPSPCSNEIYEERMRAVVEQAVADGFTHVAFGDLFLADIRDYRERHLARLGLAPVFPLWGYDTTDLAAQMTAAGVKAWITCVDPARVPRDWAGRCFDAQFVADLPPGVDPCGENGEFHTFVFEGPMLAAPVRAKPGARYEQAGFVYADLLGE